MPPLDIKISDKPVTVSKLPDVLHGWMDVLSIEEIDGVETLVVRNKALHTRVGIDISQHSTLNKLKTGHKVALTKGKFSAAESSENVKNKYAVTLMLTPSKGAEVSFEGEYGFSYLNLAEPEEV